MPGDRETPHLHAWLSTVLHWQFSTSQIVDFIELETKELITESEYRELEANACEEYLPVHTVYDLELQQDVDQDVHYERQ